MRVGIGPRNTAGQGLMLAQALRRSGIDADSFATEQHKAPLGWPVDRRLHKYFWREPGWDRYLATFTHLILWNGIGAMGRWFDVDPDPRAAVMFRGSEFRRPEKHAALEPWSPFGKDRLSDALRYRSAVIHQRLARWPGQVFVATAGMCDYSQRAVWCPIIAAPAQGAPLFTRKRPIVLHNPTNLQIKGTVEPDPAYDLRQPGMVTAAEMLRKINQADVLVGGLRLGDYGGTEIQGMAAGRLVVGNVSERVRSRIGVPVPIVQANPDTIVDVLRDIASRPDDYRAIAAQGPAFHARFHDGSYSVAQLGGFLEMAVAA